MPASSVSRRPASAQPTAPGRWTSPTDTASASPQARWRVSAEVQGPIPGSERRRRSASARGHPGDLLQPLRHVGGADDGPGADALHACPVPRPGGDPRPGTGGREDPHPGRGGPRRRLPVPEHERPPGPACLGPDDLLLQDGRHQRLEHPARPADPQIRVPPVHLGQQRVHRPEAGPVVVRAQQPGQGGEHPGGAGAPGPGEHRRAITGRRTAVAGPSGPAGHDPHGGRAVRGTRRPPHRTGWLDPEGWIAGAAPVHPQGPGQVHLERRLPAPGEHDLGVGCVGRPRRGLRHRAVHAGSHVRGEADRRRSEVHPRPHPHACT